MAAKTTWISSAGSSIVAETIAMPTSGDSTTMDGKVNLFVVSLGTMIPSASLCGPNALSTDHAGHLTSLFVIRNNDGRISNGIAMTSVPVRAWMMDLWLTIHGPAVVV